MCFFLTGRLGTNLSQAQTNTDTSGETIWSAGIDVSDHSGGSLIVGSFSNVGGTENVTPTLLWYAASVNQIRLTFRTAPSRAGLTLHLGDLALPVSESSSSGNRWVWRNVDTPDWADRETNRARLVRGGADAATATDTPLPTATYTPVPTATDTPTPTATATLTNTTESPARCKTLMDGFTFLFPENYFLIGSVELYADSHCQVADPAAMGIPGDGMVYTADGAAAAALCKAGHYDGAEYSVEVSQVSANFWTCNRVSSTATATATNTPTSTNTALPSASNTAAPKATDKAVPPANSRDVYGLDAVSNSAGELTVSWNAPSDTPVDYRISWARASESYKTWTDLTGNAFPNVTSYTASGLDHGTLHKVQVRARFGGSSGPWTDSVDALVMDATTEEIHLVQDEREVIVAPSDMPTATATAVPSTPTTTPVPPTAMPTSTNTSVPPSATNTPVPTATNTLEPAGRTIGTVRLSSRQAGVLEVSWDAPGETPKDYRVNWAKVDDEFPTWTNLSGNHLPSSNSYTITGLDAGTRYKVRVRARHHSGGSGAWHAVVEADVAAG